MLLLLGAADTAACNAAAAADLEPQEAAYRASYLLLLSSLPLLPFPLILSFVQPTSLGAFCLLLLDFA